MHCWTWIQFCTLRGVHRDTSSAVSSLSIQGQYRPIIVRSSATFTRKYISKVRRWLQLRFYFDSTAVRLQFDRATTIRRHSSRLQALRPELTAAGGSAGTDVLRHSDPNDLKMNGRRTAVEAKSNPSCNHRVTRLVFTQHDPVTQFTTAIGRVWYSRV